MKRLIIIAFATIVALAVSAQRGRFCIAKDGKAASILMDKSDWNSVARAANDLADDVRKVTGVTPSIQYSTPNSLHRIVVGTIGKSRLIDKLVRQKKIDVSQVSGQWESYLIDVVDGDLVIAGSDKRGTIYGIYDISQRIGVSPWYWWADVPMAHQDEVWYEGGRIVQPSPTVKYRGIFINDEDWGLKPWATNNYEPELGDIGPKTYARVCELLLRLKANMLAPAMHSCTGAFYFHAESKVVCDEYGIIITTSHCEPLLLNNAAQSEWDQKRDGDWNYKTNSKTILKKWDDRLAEAARYENIYTVAMRGVHDAGLRGNLPMEERVPLIEKVIGDQRELLLKHKAYSPASDTHNPLPPQIFVPYKETMDIYENGLRVPDDITLVWVDDNYGYMKRVSNPEEQKRSGGSGVYYHLSYLGAPHDYLWLNTTPPALMYEELKKAYDTGADRYWLLNVGDIKPMELGMQTFFDMAWDIKSFSPQAAYYHQAAILARLFPCPVSGASNTTYQAILDDYYRLAWSRKPEFMGWEYQWDDQKHTGLKDTEFSFKNYDEAQQRLADYQRISDEVERLGETLKVNSEQSAAAFFELVQFPVQGAYQMNRKFLMAQLNHEMAAEGRYAEANWAARQMELAYDSIEALNTRYNNLLDGKWNGMMALSTSFTNTCQFYQKPEVKHFVGAGEKAVLLTPLRDTQPDGCNVIDLTHPVNTSSVTIVKGLGYDGIAVQLGDPTSTPDTSHPSSITYEFTAPQQDSIDIMLYTVPFWPIYEGKSNSMGISIDNSPIQVFENKFKEYDRRWKDQVMRNGAVCRLRFATPPSALTTQPLKPVTRHTLTLHGMDPGQMVQRIIVDWGGLKSSYIGPRLIKED